MAPFIWSERMSVGLDRLDEDHKVLIGVINQIEAHAGKPEQGEVTAKCLLQLRRYAEFHFAREERVMEATDFQGIPGHRKEHRDFVEQLKTLSEQFDTDQSAGVHEDLLEFLKHWLRHHILIQDMAYRPFVEHNAAAAKAAEGFSAIEVWWGN